jgi:hypothetical protein
VVAPLRAQNLAGVVLRHYPEGDKESEYVWEARRSGAVLKVCSRAPFIGRRGRGAGASGMGSAWWSPACSSGRDGRGGVGIVCGCRGDVGGALAWPDDGRNSGEQWCLVDVVGATSPPFFRVSWSGSGQG